VLKQEREVRYDRNCTKKLVLSGEEKNRPERQAEKGFCRACLFPLSWSTRDTETGEEEIEGEGRLADAKRR